MAKTAGAHYYLLHCLFLITGTQANVRTRASGVPIRQIKPNQSLFVTINKGSPKTLWECTYLWLFTAPFDNQITCTYPPTRCKQQHRIRRHVFKPHGHQPYIPLCHVFFPIPSMTDITSIPTTLHGYVNINSVATPATLTIPNHCQILSHTHIHATITYSYIV